MASELAKSVTSIFKSKNVFMQWEDSVGLPALSSHAPRYPTGEDTVDAFYQSLLMGNISPEEDKMLLRQEYLAWSRLQRPSPLLDRFKPGYLQTAVSAAKALAMSVVTQDAQARFNMRLENIIFNCFVRTTTGYMGMVSGKVDAGDQVWLLKGSKVPVVLRPVGQNNKWTLVGDACIHGIMYGSKFEEAKCSHIVLV